MNVPMTADQANLLASVCEAHAHDVPGAEAVAPVLSAAAGTIVPPAQVVFIDLTEEQLLLALTAAQVDTTRITDGIRGIASELQQVHAKGGVDPPASPPPPPEADPDLQSPFPQGPQP
jgi:hypothetical protein